MIDTNTAQPLLDELNSLYEDASYTATTYFEAAKSAEFWGKAMVFLPALVSAASAFSVALGAPSKLSTLSAIAGAVAATASFLGAERKAPYYKDSARHFTSLRHNIRFQQRVALNSESIEALREDVKSLREEYNELVMKSEPTPNRIFKKAQKKISRGELSYNHEASQSSPSS